MYTLVDLQKMNTPVAENVFTILLLLQKMNTLAVLQKMNTPVCTITVLYL